MKYLKYRMLLAGGRCYGFDTQPTQVENLDMTLPGYLEMLEALGFSHFIILERKNHLRRIVSMMIARKTSQLYRRVVVDPSLVRIELEVGQLVLGRGKDLEPRSLVAHLEREQESMRLLKQLLSDRRSLHLVYEDDISSDPIVAYRRVCEFTGIGYYNVSVKYYKTNPFDLAEVLTNFSEVERVLCGTPFEWMLDS
ncbi:MAG: hypothetical protein JSU75_06210 [Gammaproteobacteria bacterium]|nr:MAG: hypothetical protein JSU75_06210 [Gammaproteobacteria bacterium]